MSVAYCLVSDLDGCVIGSPFSERKYGEELQEEGGVLFSHTSIVEIDYNDEPLDEEGLDLLKQLQSKTRNIVSFHQSVKPKYYELSLKERLKTLLHAMNPANQTPVEDNW